MGDTVPEGSGGPRTQRPTSRSAEATRRALIDAAVTVFAEHGYEAGSVRAITAKAKVNQGAITYHFGGKEELYREVLQTVRDFLGAQPLIAGDGVADYPPAEALRLFLRQTLAPLAETAKVKRYLRVYAWEQLKPTVIREQLNTEKAFPLITLAQRIVATFMPGASPERVNVATAWLLGQTFTFIRDLDWLSRPPLQLRLDKASLEALVDTLTGLSLGGLAAASAAAANAAAANAAAANAAAAIAEPPNAAATPGPRLTIEH